MIDSSTSLAIGTRRRLQPSMRLAFSALRLSRAPAPAGRSPVPGPIGAAVLLLAMGMSGPANAVDEGSGASASPDPVRLQVGMEGRLEQVRIGGSPLEAIPIEDRRQPVIVWIAATFPHGSETRYDFRFQGLEPGDYDLRDFLRREDGSSMEGVPPLPIVVERSAPEGAVRPHALQPGRSPSLGGYRWLLIAGGIVWGLGLWLIVYWGRRRRGGAAQGEAPPANLAERLRPMIERALRGESDPQELATIERNLLSLWRRRLGLGDLPTASALAHLRQHDEAGGLMRQLELWLHRPGEAEPIDLDPMLRPYLSIPAVEWGAERSENERSGGEPR